MPERPLRQPLDEMVEQLARATSQPPPRNFRAPARVVRKALEDAVGLEVSDAQLEDALTAKAGRSPSGSWLVERVDGELVSFRRTES